MPIFITCKIDCFLPFITKVFARTADVIDIDGDRKRQKPMTAISAAGSTAEGRKAEP
jgi:hypothetical protein